MLIQRLKSKIHRVTVTEANLNYVGSITIDEELMQAAGIIEGEKVQIVNNNNGERLETYVIPGAERQRRNMPQRRCGAQGGRGRCGHHNIVRTYGHRGGAHVPPERHIPRRENQSSCKIAA